MNYVIHYKSGRIKKEGKGLSFFYYAPNSSIISIPLGSNDVPFIFTEMTKDFQTITVQGIIAFQVEKPLKLAENLDFTVDQGGSYENDNMEVLHQRLINQAQTASVSFYHGMVLKEALRSAQQLEQKLNDDLVNSNMMEMLGIKILGITITEIRPSPEMGKALEAETREALQQDADEAIYKRRNFAVEQERKIRESELNTEIAVEEKKKQITEKKMEGEILKQENEKKLRVMKMEADISIEEQKQKLMDLKASNEKKNADIRNYSVKAELEPFKNLDWKTIMAMQSSGKDTGLNIALAFRELAEKSEKINNLNISPELLDSLARWDSKTNK